MKKYINNHTGVLTLIMLTTLISACLFQACEKDDADSGGNPSISYIRMTDPDKSDSLITHAYMGNIIAIVGENLQDVKEIWFNDQSAMLNTSLITSTSIIVMIPGEIPGTVTNKMLLICSHKADTFSFDFGVDVPPPAVNSMLCEFVEDGGTAVIQGNYFIDDPGSPLEVVFPGNLEATVTKVSLTEIEVTVPVGSAIGPIQVKSIYGSSRSKFYFRDDRNYVLDFDVLTAAGGWRSGVIANSDPDPISGNYVRFQGTMTGGAGSTWDEDHFSFNLWPIANGRPDVPLYDGSIANAAIKFECNVVEDWKASALQMIFTGYDINGTNSYIADESVPRGLWIPWQETGTYDTDGWITVTIPLSRFNRTPTGGTCANPLTKDMLRGLTFFVFNGGVEGTDCTPNICIDNIRIVPIN